MNLLSRIYIINDLSDLSHMCTLLGNSWIYLQLTCSSRYQMCNHFFFQKKKKKPMRS